jgi:hypothetical protein
VTELPTGPADRPRSLGETLIAPATIELDEFEEAPAPPPPPPPPPRRESLPGTATEAWTFPEQVQTKATRIAPQVMAVTCPANHKNPPYASACRVCREPIAAQTPREMDRPSLGHLKLSSGGTVVLDRGAILGRHPRLPEGAPGPTPYLIRIADPHRDISSLHLEVRLEDWFVTVRDLGSTNGTVVLVPGRPPQTLRAHEPVAIEPGTRVILAGAFDFLFEATA